MTGSLQIKKDKFYMVLNLTPERKAPPKVDFHRLHRQG